MFGAKFGQVFENVSDQGFEQGRQDLQDLQDLHGLQDHQNTSQTPWSGWEINWATENIW